MSLENLLPSLGEGESVRGADIVVQCPNQSSTASAEGPGAPQRVWQKLGKLAAEVQQGSGSS